MDECGALKHNIRADCRTANKFAPILCNFTVAMACTVAPCCTVAAGARCVPSQLIYQRGRAHGCARVVLRSAKGGEDGVSEAMLERLRKAEEEAARLREVTVMASRLVAKRTRPRTMRGFSHML